MAYIKACHWMKWNSIILSNTKIMLWYQNSSLHHRIYNISEMFIFIVKSDLIDKTAWIQLTVFSLPVSVAHWRCFPSLFLRQQSPRLWGVTAAEGPPSSPPPFDESDLASIPSSPSCRKQTHNLAILTSQQAKLTTLREEHWSSLVTAHIDKHYTCPK